MKEKTWIDEMIIREATPKPLRKDTIKEFCEKWGVAERTYSYQSAKKENQRQIINLWLSEVTKDGLEVLQVLAKNAKEGKEKSIEMYLKFVLELKERMDLTSDNQKIVILAEELQKKYEPNKGTSENS